MVPAMKFRPHEKLAAALLAALGPGGDDGAHDGAHLVRVWRNVCAIASGLDQTDAPDMEVLAAAAILHDCVAVEKNHPDRVRASRMAASRARDMMAPFQWAAPRLDSLAHAIEAHSFAAGVAPESLEAKILQDADRLDALGTIGVARCFYVAGRMGAQLYDAADPDARHRELDDTRFAVDHFHTKLLRLAGGFQTAPGRRMAEERTAWMLDFLETLNGEM